MPVEMDVHTAQWIGKRGNQEDAYMVRHFPSGVLLLVCDGMGGHCYGQEASRAAVESFSSAFAEVFASGASVPECLNVALQRANRAVGCRLKELQAYGGTTLLAAFVGRGVLWWVSVGDSPLLLWRRGHLIQLNEDHSMRGVYREKYGLSITSRQDLQACGSVLRSALTGVDREMALIDVRESPYPLLPGDRLLLCSDGMDELLLVRPLAASTCSLLSGKTDDLAARLIEACCALGSPAADNATILSLDVA